MDAVKYMSPSNKSVYNLMSLEALCIKVIKPTIYTKDEYKRRNLVIKKINERYFISFIFSIIFFLSVFLQAFLF